MQTSLKDEMKYERHKINFLIEKEKYLALQKLSAKQGVSISRLIRDAVTDALDTKHTEEHLEQEEARIEEAVSKGMKKDVDRLAGLTVKGSILEARSFFLLAKFLELLAQATELCTAEEYQEILEKTQVLGARYMGVREENSDNFIKSAINNL